MRDLDGLDASGLTPSIQVHRMDGAVQSKQRLGSSRSLTQKADSKGASDDVVFP